jgi:thioredoxin-dependent peroxiredoxin
VVLGVSFDDPAANKVFKQKNAYPFDLLSDSKRELAVALGAAADADAKHAKRQTFVIGPDGRIEQAITQVDPKSHPAALLKTLP